MIRSHDLAESIASDLRVLLPTRKLSLKKLRLLDKVIRYDMLRGPSV